MRNAQQRIREGCISEEARGEDTEVPVNVGCQAVFPAMTADFRARLYP